MDNNVALLATFTCVYPVNRSRIFFILKHFAPQGCFEQILEGLKEHANIVGGIAAGIGVLEVK